MSSRGAMFLLEVARPQRERDLIVSCDHGKTELTVPNFARPDPARAAGYFGRLIVLHRRRIAEIGEEGACDCLVVH
jgi:hypothetical protein